MIIINSVRLTVSATAEPDIDLPMCAAWGENGSFPDMASLDVSINPFDEWHLDNLLGNYAMPELQILAAAHSNLTGMHC